MTKPTNDEFVFVEVTKTFMMTRLQARRMVSVSRLLMADVKSYGFEQDGSRVVTQGDDFLTSDSQPDYADAAAVLADPEGLMNAHLVSAESRELSSIEIDDCTEFWPSNWREVALAEIHGGNEKPSLGRWPE